MPDQTTDVPDDYWPCACVRRDRAGNLRKIKLNSPQTARCPVCKCVRPGDERKDCPEEPMHPLDRLKTMRRDLKQLIRDCQYWNTIRPDSSPVDCEPERVMLAKCEAAIRAWGSAAFSVLCSEVTQYATEIRRTGPDL
jgi:hypothetical protein